MAEAGVRPVEEDDVLAPRRDVVQVEVAVRQDHRQPARVQLPHRRRQLRLALPQGRPLARIEEPHLHPVPEHPGESRQRRVFTAVGAAGGEEGLAVPQRGQLDLGQRQPGRPRQAGGTGPPVRGARQALHEHPRPRLVDGQDLR